MSDFYERHPDALRLNADNYYSAEASADYWSNSQYKSFMRCEARQMAVMQGRWHDDDRNPALIGGNYMHTAVLEPEKLADYERAYPFIKKQALPSHEDLKAIAAENGVDLTGAKSSKPKTIERLRNAGVLPEPVTKWDHRYAWLPHAIRALTEDEGAQPNYLSRLLDDPESKTEVILAFELGGLAWKCAIDLLVPSHGIFVDLKSAKDLRDGWIEYNGRNVKVPWYFERGYVTQFAIYREAIRQNYGEDFTPHMFAVTKRTDYPDKEWKVFDTYDALDRAVEDVEMTIGHLEDVKRGRATAQACGACDYCRKNKRWRGTPAVCEVGNR